MPHLKTASNIDRAPRKDGGGRSSKDESEERPNSALLRIQAKSSFSSVLRAFEGRSTAGSMKSGDQDGARPCRPLSGGGDLLRSNTSEGSPSRGRRHRADGRSFLPREDSSLEAVQESPRVNPLVVHLVAIAAAEECIGGAVSAVVCSHLCGGGGALGSRSP